MSQSVLLNIARKSIEEVLRAERLIDVPKYIEENHVLSQHIASFVNIYLDDELRGSSGTIRAKKTLIDDIIYNAKIAAFETSNVEPLKSSEYLSCVIEVTLLSPLQKIDFSNYSELKKLITQNRDGIFLTHNNKNYFYLPNSWGLFKSKDEFLTALVGGDLSIFDKECEAYIFEAQSAHDEPIINDDFEAIVAS
ncbi:MAG: AmmeMemoRadiSam system protein A [Campylobacterota bacterium]|nr:AmmeMemoRadiSam system protein A [Campylobacterota bacterium]